MSKEFIYIAATREDAVILKSTKEPDKVWMVKKVDLYQQLDHAFIGGDIGNGFYPCLYSKALNHFYTNLYQKSSKVLYQLHTDGSYTEIHSRLNLPVCDVFALSDKFIIVGNYDALVTPLECSKNGFTGLVFDSVIWDHKLFLQAQTFKLYGDGLYFVYNVVYILRSDLSLYQVYRTDLALVRHLESKYDLHPQASTSCISSSDLDLIKTKLQLYNLNKQQDGVYLDTVKIFGG